MTYDAPLRVFAPANTICYVFPDATTHATALAAYFEIAHTVKPVPAVVTMRQARLALLGAGLLAGVKAAINALPSKQKEAAKIEWEYATDVQRSSGLVLMMGAALGLDDAALDALFVAAAAL